MGPFELLNQVLETRFPFLGEHIPLRGPVTLLLTLLLTHLVARIIERRAAVVLDRAGNPEIGTARTIRRFVRYPTWLIGALLGLHLAGVDMKFLRRTLGDTLFEISGTPISLLTLIVFVVVLFATWWISRLAQGAVSRGFRLNGVDDEGTIGVTRRLVHYLVMAIGIGIALETVGINLSALFAAGAVFAVGIGFALQNITENFVSGVILLLERAIKPGDILEIDGEIVRVRHMNIRSTVVRTLDEQDLIVPNGQLVSAKVRNMTFDDDLHRVRCAVGVSYEADMRLVKETLERVGREFPLRTSEVEPRVLMTSFGDNSVNWELSAWCREPWRKATQSSQLFQAVWWAFKEADIEIAFPQLDIHLDPELAARLGRPPGAPPGDA
ncbi:MAG: mechanosensitive ion channel [Alphaproteobacteria bacterium]|nr:mechanosensitive ion channel [Alphaproteobacteria bacterium]